VFAPRACCTLTLAAAFAGCSDDRDKAPSAPTGREKQVSIEIIGTDLHPDGPPAAISGQAVMLIGEISTAPSPWRVELLASEHPYTRWRRIDVAEARHNPTFRVRPRRNTRYRFRLADPPRSTSKPQKVYVDLKGRLTASIPEPGVAELTYIGNSRRPAVAGDGRTHFYVREANRGPLERVATGRPRQRGPRGIVVAVRHPEFTPEQSDRFFACTVGQLAEGYGHPDPSDPQCGKRTLRATARRMNAPG
jgi:hypothetical protein